MLAMELVQNFVEQTWLLAVAMAPYLFVGFLVAGLLHEFMPVEFVSKHIGKESLGSIIKAALLGMPLPLCSCGVLPVAAGIRRAGAGKAPTAAFLITTPVSGVDSVLATYALLGWVFTVVRVGLSFLIGMLVGVGVWIINRGSKADPSSDTFNLVVGDAHDHDGEGVSCTDCSIAPDVSRSVFERIKSAIWYGVFELPSSLASSLLVGLLLGGVISTFIPQSYAQVISGTGLLGILAATAVAVPLYVCATGSIPIAAGMIMSGFSPGAALAFLVAGPATNTVAFATVKKILGWRELLIYLVVIFTGAIFGGWLFDSYVSVYGLDISNRLSAISSGSHVSVVGYVSGAALIVWVLVLWIRGLNLDWLGFLHGKPKGGSAMNTIRVVVPDMSCMHCKMAIEKALRALSFVEDVAVDLNSKEVVVYGQNELDSVAVVSAIESAGYSVQMKQ